ncbi:MAG: hotdog domain-containing protein [Pseudomonadales bacterium]|nr:hotdog domain-containing protein [Pseudomonadales bacterium]
MAKILVECVAQIYFGEDVEIRTVIDKLGNSSILVNHEVWQRELLVARDDAVMAYF